MKGLIMTHETITQFSSHTVILLLGSAAAAVLVPIAFGMTRVSQQATTAPSFEVASIRPHNPTNRCCSLTNAGGGRMSAVGLTVKALVGAAYHVRDFQIFGGPSWINSEQFDIEAKAATVTDMTPERSPLLLQQLLADRFHLRVHTEKRDLPTYELVIANNGHKLRAMPPPEAVAPGTADTGPGQSGVFRWTNGDISGTAVPFDRFVGVLSILLERPVVDKTALTGFFEIKLQRRPDAAPNGGASPFDAYGASLFTAMQEQLGLRLQSTRVPMTPSSLMPLSGPLRIKARPSPTNGTGVTCSLRECLFKSASTGYPSDRGDVRF
jgi:uncharacterized protein (TIGR03435 family)